MDAINYWQIKVGICADEHPRILESEPRKQVDVTHLAELLIVDETELLRDRHDFTHLAMILIGRLNSQLQVETAHSRPRGLPSQFC